MPTLRKLSFLLEELQPQSPGQQLLDRFLIGYPDNGTFQTPNRETTAAYVMVSGTEPDFDQRPEEFGLAPARTAEAAVEGADAIVVASRKPGAVANERLVEIALAHAPEGAACFVHGALANSLARAKEFTGRARSRKMALLAGTPLGVTWRLPEVSVPPGTALRRALIVVQGTSPGAELHGLEGLLPVLEHRRGGESGVRSLRFLEGTALWRAGDKGLWSPALLAAALSRSDTPQGDPVADGRTQDLFGLGLVPKLAHAPRGWILEHADGLVSAILVLDGVVGDFNFAVQTSQGPVISAQLFRAPPPAEHHYSRLAALIDRFFTTRHAPWSIERNWLVAGLLERMAQPATRTGRPVATPSLRIAYGAGSV